MSILCFLFLSIFALCLEAQARAGSIWPYPPGTVLVSRNVCENENTSPGYWNHLAIYVGNGLVVESQEPCGVQQVSINEFASRRYSVVMVFLPKTQELGYLAAARAMSMIGTPYRKLSSVFPRVEARGMNCVSVINQAYCIHGYRPRMRKPDDIFCETCVLVKP